MTVRLKGPATNGSYEHETFTGYAICASLYGAARAVAYTRDRQQELLYLASPAYALQDPEMAAGTLVSAVVHVIAIAIERRVRDMPDPRTSLPFPLDVCFPHDRKA